MNETFKVNSIGKVLEEPIRVRILAMILEGGEMTMTDAAKVTGIFFTNINRHIRYCEMHEIVISRKKAQHVIWSLNNLYKDTIISIFKMTGVFSHSIIKTDLKIFKDLEQKGEIRAYLHED